MKYPVTVVFLFLISIVQTDAQKFTTTNAQKLVRTHIDSLQTDANTRKTVISGGGSAFYQINFDQEL